MIRVWIDCTALECIIYLIITVEGSHTVQKQKKILIMPPNLEERSQNTCNQRSHQRVVFHIKVTPHPFLPISSLSKECYYNHPTA